MAEPWLKLSELARRRPPFVGWLLVLVLAAACGDDRQPRVSDGSPAVPIATATAPRPAARPAAAATATTTATVEPSPLAAAELPIIDLHFHPEAGWGDLEAIFDQTGVAAAGNGAGDDDAVALTLAERYPGRVLAFGGGSELRRLILAHGQAAWTLANDETRQYLAGLEAQAAADAFDGIGEVHVNNWGSNIIGSPQYRFPADSALVAALLALAAEYQLPFSVHMDAEAESVAQMERLLTANRDGVWLWAHTGHYAEPELLRRLLEEHPNLYCELSYRLSISGSRTAIAIDSGGSLRESWRELLEDFPDRFVIGTDLGFASPASYAAMIAFWRLILEQLSPRTAARVAYLNAERLLGGDR